MIFRCCESRVSGVMSESGYRCQTWLGWKQVQVCGQVGCRRITAEPRKEQVELISHRFQRRDGVSQDQQQSCAFTHVHSGNLKSRARERPGPEPLLRSVDAADRYRSSRHEPYDVTL